MCSNKVRPQTIQLPAKTKAALDTIKHRGQSYNGLIQELIEFWKKAHPNKETKEKGG